MNGQNAHFGSPLNGAAPERISGGSSSGSASAVSNRPVRLRARQRHRRLGARAGEPLRPGRPAADARPGRAWRARSTSRRASTPAAGSRATCRPSPASPTCCSAPIRRPCRTRCACSRRATSGACSRPRCVDGAGRAAGAGRGGARRGRAGRRGARELRDDVLELSLPAGARGLAHRRRPDRSLRAAARAGREGALRLGARGERAQYDESRGLPRALPRLTSRRCSAATACC